MVGPASAWVPNTRIRVIPSDTITIPIGVVPRRWNGVYTTLLRNTDTSAPAAIPASALIQMFTPP